MWVYFYKFIITKSFLIQFWTLCPLNNKYGAVAKMLKNSVALITGCGSGFGRATAKRFVVEGARVIGVDINEETGAQIQEFGGDVTFCKADLSDEVQVQEAMKTIEDKHNHLDVVVNCAGISATFPLFNANKWTLDKFILGEYLLKYNVISTFNVCRLAVPLMLKNTADEDGHRGIIINTTGFTATEGIETQSFYAGTMGAINSMTVPMSRDLADNGIRVVTIAPGLFESPIVAYWPKQVKAFFSQLSLFPHRLGNLDEFADHAVGVVGNKMINGVVIRLDGGLRTNL